MPLQNTKTKRWWEIEISFGGISHTDILFFTKHLSVGLKTGLTLLEGLEMLCDQASGKMQDMLNDIIDFVKSGQPFYKALARHPKYFSSMYINLIKSAEYAGRLEENLKYLAEDLLKAHDMRRKIKGALAYPTIVTTVVILLGFAVSIFILPKIVPVLKTFDVELPATTRALIMIADIMHAYGIIIGISLLIFIPIGYHILRQDFVKPVLHRIILILPVIKHIAKKINVARFTRSLGTLLASGITLDTSLKITLSSTDNFVYQQAIEALRIEIEKGKTLATAMAYYPKLFPVLVSRMIAMGEKTGSLSTTLRYLTEFYEDDVDSVLKNLSMILEPFLLLFVGILVGTLALAILGPFFQLGAGI